MKRQEDRMKTHRAVGWLVWSAGLFVLIVVSFLLYGERLEEAVQALRQSETSRQTAALGLALLLAADIVLPIPSAGVSAAIGALLGFWWGAIASTLAMTIACIVGYAIGRYGGRAAAMKLVGASELHRAERLGQRYGDWAVVGLRGVPVLAEASVIVAGTARLPFGWFLLSSAIANVGISVAYAAAGVIALETRSLALAFSAAVGVPLLALGLMRAMAFARRNRAALKVEVG
jgi:uncharacterized membrane protein YdjX (TVP38/TMEM64 family)